MTLKFLFGADPELFLQHHLDGTFHSAHGIIPGTKKDPHRIALGAVQVDGTALEYNIDPVSSLSQWMNNHTVVRRILSLMINSIRPDLVVTAVPTAFYTQAVWDHIPDTAKELGCDPDFNAYKGEENKKPETTETFRTGSGHIHIGWGERFDPYNNIHFRICCDLVRQLDAVLYIPSLVWDSDIKRRTLYGARGAFRPKPYGLEYRVLSNKWLDNPKIMAWVFSATKRATELFFEGRRIFEENFVNDTIEKEFFMAEEKTDFIDTLVKQYGILRMPKV